MSPIPYGNAAFEIWFDLIAHKLVQQASDGSQMRLPPTARPVADLSRDFVHLLQGEPGDWPELPEPWSLAETGSSRMPMVLWR